MRDIGETGHGVARLVRVVRELQELPGWPMIQMAAGLVIADVLTAVGWAPEEIADLLGLDPRAYLEERPEMVGPYDEMGGVMG